METFLLLVFIEVVSVEEFKKFKKNKRKKKFNKQQSKFKLNFSKSRLLIFTTQTFEARNLISKILPAFYREYCCRNEQVHRKSARRLIFRETIGKKSQPK